MPAARRILLLLLAILLLLLFLAVPGVSWADALEDSARELARRIAGALPPNEVAVLSLRNLSSLGAAEVAAVRRALEAELRSRGARPAAGGAAPVEARVTLSENLTGYLWVAEIRRGEQLEVAMLALPRSAAPAASRPAPSLSIQKEILWEQKEPILALALLDSPGTAEQRMAVLESSTLALYHRLNGRWEFQQAFPIVSAKPWPRDLRGMLLYDKATQGQGVLGIVLPGMGCHLHLRGTPRAPQMQCEQDDKIGWFIFTGARPADAGAEFTASRNFYTGKFYDPETSQIARTVPPFLSAAVLPGEPDGPAHWIYAGLDGETQIHGDGAERSASFSGWGSDLASVQTNCGAGWQVLATRPGDWTEPDAIRAYEIREGSAVAVSPPVDLPGPVMSLGPLAEGAALAVARNLKTGRYEAYSLTISCSR